MIDTTDYLVLGSGISGLTLAIKLAETFPDRKITIITKAHADESNTKYAQGGIAVVVDQTQDHFDQHIQDTFICGDGLCDAKVVQRVVHQGPERLKELMEWGTRFDKTTDGILDLGQEGGHSNKRVVHYQDQTGWEIQRALLEKVSQTSNIILRDHYFALDFILHQNQCLGVWVLNEKKHKIIGIHAHFTILATGGIGQMYEQTTNPMVATADGLAMAIRAGAKLAELEFIQFHPTALYHPTAENTFLISEAVRGYGAQLKNHQGNRFMFDYDSRGELASRDIVSRAIQTELAASQQPCVYLDCTHFDPDDLKQKFPTIYQNCLIHGIDATRDWIPVKPAQHYMCGGIVVNQNGQTSIEKLLACGECSRTGLHGANRLASNSLLEALVYSEAIYQYLRQQKMEPIHCDEHIFPLIVSDATMLFQEIQFLKKQLQKLMQQNVGIVRKNAHLLTSQTQVMLWLKQVNHWELSYGINKNLVELKNMLTTAWSIIEHSIQRTNNCGAFYKIDDRS
ncbi:L-aspartate oxidase [Flavobacterium sp. CYK-55]|uniref:L-aspartate oxidase n=1 Tax=Flavobacterium sp. CYK-55 TaxID=2835529 RepID=UPI001BCABCE7|nr:L-aspartate oxidase [Flavobacterium sp. CYK-55]MBS7786602.1 L-aspartate oxidase [Flavobacterium sp. CYK-55]